MGRGRPKGTRLPGEHGISRPTIAQGRPSDWHHLYAAVRFPCAPFSRSGPRVLAGTRPSLRPLGQEGGVTKQSSGETRREDAKVCLQVESALEDDDAAPCSVIASAAKQSSVFPQRDSGLLRCARNDDVERTCDILRSRAPDAAQRPFDDALQSRGPSRRKVSCHCWVPVLRSNARALQRAQDTSCTESASQCLQQLVGGPDIGCL